jgi:hypothetical protein
VAPERGFRLAGDANQVSWAKSPTGDLSFDLDALAVPLTPEAQAVANAIGELGVVHGVAQVAAAVARTPFGPDGLAASLGRFAENLTSVGDQLMAVPGVGDALQVFGGVGGVAAGALGLKRELDDIKARGLGPENALGIASRAAQLVGGFAMALSPLCPPLAAPAAALMTAGAALALGKLGWEHRDTPMRIVSNNGASMVAEPAWKWVTG